MSTIRDDIFKPYKDIEGVYWYKLTPEEKQLFYAPDELDKDGNPKEEIKREVFDIEYWTKKVDGSKGPFWVLRRKKGMLRTAATEIKATKNNLEENSINRLIEALERNTSTMAKLLEAMSHKDEIE